MEAGLDEEIAYAKNLLQALEKGIADCGNQKIQETAKKMKELLENEQIREIRLKDDKDARFGHKTATAVFKQFVLVVFIIIIFTILLKAKWEHVNFNISSGKQCCQVSTE